MVEKQTKEIRVDAARGAEDGGQKADVAVVRTVRQILSNWSWRLPALSGWCCSCDEACPPLKGRPSVRVSPPLICMREIKDPGREELRCDDGTPESGHLCATAPCLL